MVDIKLEDLEQIEAGGFLGAIAGAVIGFDAGLVVGLGAWAISGDENAVLGCASSGAGIGFYVGAGAPTP